MLRFLLPLPLLLVLYYMRRKQNPLNKIPGPTAYPLLGNVPHLDMKKLYLQLVGFSKQYGGIFKLYFFSKPVVVVSDYDYIHEVLVKQSAAFSGRPSSFRAEIVSEHLGALALTDAGQVVKGRRQAVRKFLKRFGSGIEKIEEATQISTGDLINRCVAQNGSPIQIRDFLFYTMLDVIVILLMGDTIPEDEKIVLQATMDTLNEVVRSEGGMVLDLFPFTRFLGSKTYNKMQDVIKVKRRLLTKWMESRPTEGFIHFIQTMSDKEKEKSFLDTDRTQSNMCFEFLAAGSFSASNTLTYLMNVLCHHQQVETKLWEEVFKVIGPSRYPVLADQENMPYLSACLLEINRYISVSPLTIPHKAVQTCRLGPYTIPKDTEVWVNLWALHHDERLWEQPFEFKPERFLDDDGQLVPANHPKRKYLLPFGAGHRACVGEEFAASRMFLITARILQNFVILPESTLEKQPSCDPRVMKPGVVGLPPEIKVRMKCYVR